MPTTTTKVRDANTNNNNKSARCQQHKMAKVSHAKISPRPRLGKTLRPRPKTLPNISVKQIQIHTNKVKPQSTKTIPRLLQLLEHHSLCQFRASVCSNLLISYNEALALPESHHEAEVLRPQTPITSVAGASMACLARPDQTCSNYNSRYYNMSLNILNLHRWGQYALLDQTRPVPITIQKITRCP